MKHIFSSLILKASLFLLSLPIFSQEVHVLPGDPGFSTSQIWPGPILQWAPRFAYTSPLLQAGTYKIIMTFQEPTVTGPGQRVFTVGWLNFTSDPIDIWKMTGGTLPVTITGQAVIPFPKHLVISFTALVRNAIVSSIDIIPIFPLTQGVVFISHPEDITASTCPDGWTGPKLSDGACIAIFFSQTQNSPGQ